MREIPTNCFNNKEEQWKLIFGRSTQRVVSHLNYQENVVPNILKIKDGNKCHRKNIPIPDGYRIQKRPPKFAEISFSDTDFTQESIPELLRLLSYRNGIVSGIIFNDCAFDSLDITLWKSLTIVG